MKPIHRDSSPCEWEESTRRFMRVSYMSLTWDDLFLSLSLPLFAKQIEKIIILNRHDKNARNFRTNFHNSKLRYLHNYTSGRHQSDGRGEAMARVVCDECAPNERNSLRSARFVCTAGAHTHMRFFSHLIYTYVLLWLVYVSLLRARHRMALCSSKINIHAIPCVNSSHCEPSGASVVVHCSHIRVRDLHEACVWPATHSAFCKSSLHLNAP